MMKMHSKIIGIFSLMIFCVEVVYSTSTQDLYLANQALILSQKATLVEPILFTVGRVQSKERFGLSVGLSKATLRAYQNIDWFLFKSAPWPSLVKEDERAILWEMYRMTSPFNVKLEGVERVVESHDAKDKFTVVLAIPMDEIKKLPVVSEETLLITLQHYRSYTDLLLKENEHKKSQLIE